MPSQKEKQNGKNPPNKPVSNTESTISGNKTQNSSNEQIGANQTNTKEKKSNKPTIIEISKIPKVDVIEGIEANKIARQANFLTKISIGVRFYVIALYIDYFTAFVCGVNVTQWPFICFKVIHKKYLFTVILHFFISYYKVFNSL